MPRIIKKYENRRLYDTEASRYVNLEGVAQLVREGADIQVQDAKTGEDLTRSVLTQIIVEGSRDQDGGPPLDFLRELIRSRDRAQRDFLHWYLGKWADAWKGVQESWRVSSPGLPRLELGGPAKAAREVWEKVFDPFGTLRAVVRGAQGRREGDAAGGEPDREAASEISELRRRLEELESRLSGKR